MSRRYHKVVVVGGSISGLAAALTLNRIGCDVTNLEKRSEEGFKDQGAGLALRPDVIKFFNTYKSQNAAISLFEGHDTTVLEQDGSFAGMAPWPKGTFSTTWGSVTTALRQSLLAKPCFGSNVTRIIDGDKCTVEYEKDGKTLQISDVDLVVGADGANSTVRSLMGQHPDREYAGYTFVRGIAELDRMPPKAQERLGSNANIMVVSNHSNVILYRIGQNTAMWGVYRKRTSAQRDEELLDRNGHRHAWSVPWGLLRDEILEDVKDWTRRYFCDELSQAVQTSSTAALQVISDCRSSQNTFLGGKVLLIGEASALPRPHVAAGTVHSVYHARRLGDLVEGKIGIEEWSRNTRNFSTTLLESSREQGEIWMESEGNLDVVLRSRAAMGKMMQRLDAIQNDLRPISVV